MIENLELLWNKFGNTWKKFSLPISLLSTFLSYSRDDEERRTETRINPQPNYEPNSNKKHLFAENPARFSSSPSHPSHRETRVLNASEKDGSDPSGFVGAPWPLKRNSTIARTSTDVFARHVWVDRVGIEVRVRRRYFRRDHALFDVLSDLTHPFLDGDLPAFPDELAYRDHASDPHTAHQHHEHAADVRQSQLVRRRAALRDIVLLAEQTFVFLFPF